MTDATASPPRGTARRGALLAVGGLTLPLSLAGLQILPPAGYLALSVWAGIAALVLDRLPAGHPHGRFGLANGITLARAAGTALVAGFALVPEAIGNAWALVAATGLMLALDGVDGWVARRQGLASSFGARFDMEVDAGLILTLSLLAATLGKAGPWVLAIGLMRYTFVLAGRIDPALARPLPPSRRRSVVCGLQVAALGVVLAPPVAPPASAAVAAAALALLAFSFAADLAWLWRAR